MKEKNCLIFGGSGQIGRHLIRKLTKNNIRVTVVTRNIHQKSYMIKTQGNAGYLDIVESNIYDEKKIRELFKKSDICINLVGILYEKKRGNTFKNIHSLFPSLLAKLSKEYNLNNFIHLSALGINEAIDSEYALSKLEGEKNILKNFPSAIILRPSVVYSVDDNFTTTFMTLLNRLPLFPIYYNGRTKFTPIHCSDLTNIIHHIIENSINSKIKSFWNYQGAQGNWSCVVLINQAENGAVEGVKVVGCDNGNNESPAMSQSKALAFASSIRRAVFKSSPLPPAPDEAVFSKEIMLTFKVN